MAARPAAAPSRFEPTIAHHGASVAVGPPLDKRGEGKRAQQNGGGRVEQDPSPALVQHGEEGRQGEQKKAELGATGAHVQQIEHVGGKCDNRPVQHDAPPVRSRVGAFAQKSGDKRDQAAADEFHHARRRATRRREIGDALESRRQRDCPICRPVRPSRSEANADNEKKRRGGGEWGISGGQSRRRR